jgi:integrase
MPHLKETQVRNAKPKEKPFKLYDERGLFLLVKPNGAKLWRFKYRFANVEKLLALGAYPDIGLRDAREKRDDARKLVANRKDPSEQRREEKLANADTFKVIAEEYVALQAKTLAPETISIMRGRLETTLYPRFGNRPIRDIKAAELLSVLRQVEARGTHETAHRVRALFGRIARFAVASGKAERDVSADLKGALAPVAKVNFPAITDPARFGQLLRMIDSYKGEPSTEYALRLAPLLFVRPGELRHAEWQEFTLDGPDPEWRIPGAKMKMKEQHVVPVSRQAIALLRKLHELTGDSRYLFPGLRDRARPISENTLNSALRALGIPRAEHTAHGFRSSASTFLNEQGWHPDLIELQLAHAERDEVRGAYNRAQRLAERRKMMQHYSDFLDGLKAGGNVVSIGRKIS